MPPGNRSGQPGAAVPLYGESEVRGQSTAFDLLTLTLVSSAANAAFVVRSNVAEGSTVNTGDMFRLGSSGELQRFQYTVVALSTTVNNSTAITMGSSRSGSIFFSSAYSSGVNFILPAPELGMVYTVIQGAGGSSHGANITSTAGTGADILYASSAVGTTVGAIQAIGTGAGAAVTLIAVSTTRWYAMQHTAVSSAWTSSVDGIANFGSIWIAGTTA